MIGPLTAVEVRVLGALVEKETATPDNYPLSLNALIGACNQLSNRDPIMKLDEETVTAAIDSLRRESLVRAVHRTDSRVTKYRHLLTEAASLDGAERAVMCVLMLRGPQTMGEIRTRTQRLAEFADLSAVETTLAALMARQPVPLVARLERRPGQKDVRYAHLLAGDVTSDLADVVPTTKAPEDDARVSALEASVDELRRELTDLRAQFDDFKRQF